MTTYDCMSEAELTLWRTVDNPGVAAKTPCIDCPLWFATERRAEGCCNGNPGINPGRPRKSPDVHLGGRGRPGYPTEELRLAARRKAWRESKQRSRGVQYE